MPVNATVYCRQQTCNPKYIRLLMILLLWVEPWKARVMACPLRLLQELVALVVQVPLVLKEPT